MSSADEAAIRKLVDSPAITMRSDYIHAVTTWRSVFGDEQVFIGFFDDLVSKPADLLRSILAFLGVDASDEHVPTSIAEVVNAGPKRDFPEALLPHMYATYMDQFAELEKMVGGPVSKWLAKAEEAVAARAVTAR